MNYKKTTAVNSALILTVGTREMDQKLKPLPEAVSNSSPREFDVSTGTVHTWCPDIYAKYTHIHLKNEKITTYVRTSLLKLVFQDIT